MMGSFEDTVSSIHDENDRNLRIHVDWLLRFGDRLSTDRVEQLFHEVSAHDIAEKLGGLITPATEVIERYEEMVFGDPSYGQT